MKSDKFTCEICERVVAVTVEVQTVRGPQIECVRCWKEKRVRQEAPK